MSWINSNTFFILAYMMKYCQENGLKQLASLEMTGNFESQISSHKIANKKNKKKKKGNWLEIKYNLYIFIENCKIDKKLKMWKIKGAFSGLRQFLATEAPLKWWKMLFISSEKLLLFSKYLSFCLGFSLMYQNG